MKCKFCGFENETKASFCGSCGKKLVQSDNLGTVSKNKHLLIFFLIILTAAISYFIYDSAREARIAETARQERVISEEAERRKMQEEEARRKEEEERKIAEEEKREKAIQIISTLENRVQTALQCASNFGQVSDVKITDINSEEIRGQYMMSGLLPGTFRATYNSAFELTWMRWKEANNSRLVSDYCLK